MRRIIVTAAILVIIAALAHAQPAEQNVRTAAAKNLNISVAPNGDVIFETSKRGDSIWAVHDRFNLPGNLDSAEWRTTILPAWRAANPDVKASRRNWIFRPGRQYKVPAQYAAAFLKAAGIVQAPQSVERILQAAPVQTVVVNETPLWLWIALWAAILAALVGALVAYLLNRARRDEQERAEDAEGEVEWLEQRLERADEVAEETREHDNPVTAGPPIGSLDDDPDFVSNVNGNLDRVAAGINDDIRRNGPLTMQLFRFDKTARTLEPTGEFVVVTRVGDKNGPTYRGNIEGHLRVKFGDGEWRNCRGNGEIVYFANYNMLTIDDMTIDGPVVFVEICCNDVRFRGNEYRTDGRVVNCELVGAAATASTDNASTGGSASASGTSPTTGADGTSAAPPAASERTDPTVEEVQRLLATPFLHPNRRLEEINDLVFSSDRPARTMGIVLRFWNVVPNRFEPRRVTDASFDVFDATTGNQRLLHTCRTEGFDPCSGMEGMQEAVAASAVYSLNRLAKYGKPAQAALLAHYLAKHVPLGGINMSTVLDDQLINVMRQHLSDFANLRQAIAEDGVQGVNRRLEAIPKDEPLRGMLVRYALLISNPERAAEDAAKTEMLSVFDSLRERLGIPMRDARAGEVHGNPCPECGQHKVVHRGAHAWCDNCSWVGDNPEWPGAARNADVVADTGEDRAEGEDAGLNGRPVDDAVI